MKSKLYKFKTWTLVLGMSLWTTHSFAMEVKATPARNPAQEKLFAIVTQRLHEPLRDFLIQFGKSIDLNSPNDEGHYPLNLAMQGFLNGERGYDSIKTLREFGAQFDPSIEATQMLWANILHNAVTMKRTKRLEVFLKELKPDSAIVDYLLDLVPKYLRLHDAVICDTVVSILREYKGEGPAPRAIIEIVGPSEQSYPEHGQDELSGSAVVTAKKTKRSNSCCLVN